MEEEGGGDLSETFAMLGEPRTCTVEMMQGVAWVER